MQPIHLCITGSTILALALLSSAAGAGEGNESNEPHERNRGTANLGFDAEGAAIVAPPHALSGNTLEGGSGFKVRLGSELRAPLLRFIPEVAYGYQHLFASDSAGDSFAWNTHRILAGARMGLGELVVPVIYGHAGYGWRLTGDPTVPDASGLALDVGVGLDLHLIPHLGVGAHVEYATIEADPYRPQWLALGLHGDLAF